MDEKQLPGSAGPALAAHSKDGSAPGPTRASTATGEDGGGTSADTDTVSKISGQAREAAGRAASSISETVSSVRQNISGQGGQSVDQISAFVRDQPIAALAITGVLGLLMGVLLSRR
jgi:ElaB/YqjD/DUF883 family membrane-anchored ribosome-binding protein